MWNLRQLVLPAALLLLGIALPRATGAAEVTLASDANVEENLAGYRLCYGHVSAGP